MMKTLLPELSIFSDTIISPENLTIEEEDRLAVYEFDVSFRSDLEITLLLTSTIFIPHLSLALEYQGEQHYSSSVLLGDPAIRQRRDRCKRKFASQFGITLISIPFWWDCSSDSLASTIEYYRPDINLQSSKEVPPIPLEMPVKLKKRPMNLPSR
jgi:hypothetical protein